MKKRTAIILFSVVVVIFLAVTGVFLYERSRVAMIIDDEAAWDMRDASPQKEVIIAKDGTIARYVSEDEASYVGDIQDTFIISKKDATVETWYACDGKGFVYLKEFGETNAFLQPSSDSEVVGKLYFEQGYVPDTYRCLGYKDGWFKVEIGGQIGYVSEEYVNWDAIDTF